MRKNLFVTTLLVGLGLAVAGVILSAPVGIPTSEAFSNPRLPFAPGIFVLGVVFVFLSPVVYELWPGDEA